MALHAKKAIVATAGDDCTWKIWNLENSENIMTGEGHKDWIAATSIAHTFVDVHTGPVWKLKFHDTGDFVLSASGDGSIKLFDLNSLKMRQ